MSGAIYVTHKPLINSHILSTNTVNTHPSMTLEITRLKNKRRILLSQPRREQSSNPASSPLGEVLRMSVAVHMERLEELDKAIEMMHHVISDFMGGAKHSVGIEWSPHKTRPGLHPVLYRKTSMSHQRPFCIRRDGTVEPRRYWCDVLKPGYVQRSLDCMPGQEDRVIGPLALAFDCLQQLFDERERLLTTVSTVRRQLTLRHQASTSAPDPVKTARDLEIRTAGARAIIFLLREATPSP
jgi:hypothetical protein